jgi:hypothetical protein
MALSLFCVQPVLPTAAAAGGDSRSGDVVFDVKTGVRTICNQSVYMSLKNVYAPVPLTTRGQPTHISLHPDGSRLAYACGRTVVIRSISNPLAADVYSEHAKNVTAVKISPRC